MTDSTPKDSGFSFKLLVRLCGLAVIGGLFLPFFTKLVPLMESEKVYSVFDLIMSLVDRFKDSSFSLGEMLSLGSEGQFLGYILGGLLFLIPVIFALTGLYMLLTAKYAGGPMTFLILILLGGWLGFHFGGPGIGLESGFFSMISLGFWVGVGALTAPFLGMFFLDKSV